MKLIWLTDTHFNFIDDGRLTRFLNEIAAIKADGLILTGDISNGPNIVEHLKKIEKILKIPIYFTIGNHDVYQSSFEKVEADMIELMNEVPNINYLNACEPISLSDNTAIIGHEGWYDCRYRQPNTSIVFLADWMFIREFRRLFTMEEVLEFARNRSLNAAIFIERSLRKAFEKHSKVYLAMHFPPWPEIPEGLNFLTSWFWRPYNSCKVIASALERTMIEYPTKKLVVLAGHTHSKRTENISNNIELRVGEAERGRCLIQDIIYD